MSSRRTPRIVIAGGGVAAIEALLALHDMAEERLDIVIIAPQREFVYRPLTVASPFGLGEPPRFALEEIVGDLGGTYYQDSVVAVDVAQRVARTGDGEAAMYDALVIASGAAPVEAVKGALAYRGAEDATALRDLLAELEHRGRSATVAFAVPSGTTWPLPIYELALITAVRLGSRGDGPVVKLITPEPAPLALFGRKASEAVGELLEARGIAVRTSTHPVEFSQGSLQVVPEGRVPADRVVALPRLRGRAPKGLPCDDDGFVPVDPHGLVQGTADVYAAGDVTASSIKQGGIAAQQADVVAAAIAARFGAPVEADPFRPVLRGMLLTGDGARFLRAEVTGGRGESSEVSTEMLWWPQGKIVGRYLSHYLARKAHPLEPEPPLAADAIPVDVELAGNG